MISIGKVNETGMHRPKTAIQKHAHNSRLEIQRRASTGESLSFPLGLALRRDTRLTKIDTRSDTAADRFAAGSSLSGVILRRAFPENKG